MTTPVTAVRAWKTPLELIVLGAIWGASFLFMRIGAADFGPFALVEIRLGLGAIILFPFLWRERARSPRPCAGGSPELAPSTRQFPLRCLPGARNALRQASVRFVMR